MRQERDTQEETHKTTTSQEDEEERRERRKRKIRAALKVAEQATQTGIKTSELLIKARAYEFINDPQGVIRSCSGALELDPELATAYWLRGIAFLQIGEAGDGKQDLHKFLGLTIKSIEKLPRGQKDLALSARNSHGQILSIIGQDDPNIPELNVACVKLEKELGLNPLARK